MYWRFQESTQRVSQLLLALGIRDTVSQHRTPLLVGDQVFVRRSFRVPLSGSVGLIVAVDLADSRAPYLTKFNNGWQFRFQLSEIQRVPDAIP